MPSISQRLAYLFPFYFAIPDFRNGNQQDSWANPPPDMYAANLPVFVDILRKQCPRLSILVTGPFYLSAEASEEETDRVQSAKRRTARELVERRRKVGDRWISFVDGFKMLNTKQTSGLVDGIHCNSFGFHFHAQGLEPFLRKALKQSN